MEIAKMSTAQLTKAMEKASTESSKITQMMIDAGRGNEYPSDMMKKSDPLSLKYQKSASLLQDLYAEKNRRITYSGTMRPIKYQENPTMATKQKIFMMAVGADKPKIPEPYLFEFTHYIPMNSYGGSSVAFKFVVSDLQGDLVISELDSGKKVAQVTNYERIKIGVGQTDRQIAKITIENLLQRYGADKVYQILKKG